MWNVEISSALNIFDIIISFSILMGGTYTIILVGLYYFSSGKTIFPFYWPFKQLADIYSRFYILGGLLAHLILLFALWVSSWWIGLKIIITFLYVLSTGWLFYNTYQKYKLRIDKINQKQRGTK